MSLAGFSVKRPVTIKMIFLGVILLGFISLKKLPSELFPAIEYPQITIACVYKGAAPQEIESLVTKPIEESVGTVNGVKNIHSISREGLAMVMVEFDWGTNMDLASMSVREKIDLIKERLPQGSGEPIVVKYNPFQLPVAVLNVTGRFSGSDLYDISHDLIKNELEKVDGVASCSISGGAQKEVHIDVDQARLTASGLSILDIVEAIKKSNLNYPVGTLEENFYEQLIRTVGEFENVNQIKNVPVYLNEEVFKNIDKPYKKEAVSDVDEAPPTLAGEQKAKSAAQPGRKLVFLRDLAEIKEGLSEKTSISRYNGHDTVSLSIQKRAGASTTLVVDNIKKRLKKIRENLPHGVLLHMTYDQSVFIKEAVSGVSHDAANGGILAFLVLFLFLRNLRSSLIVATAIPISVMLIFSAMYFKGISINMISLGGLALGIGMLVDSAIVVVENITRLRKAGKGKEEAAVQGTNEVAGAITSSTITHVIVFLPMIFLAGIAGRIFSELAFTVIFSTICSLIVALTFLPSVAKSLGEDMSHKAESISRWQMRYVTYLRQVLQDKGRKILRTAVWLFCGALVILSFLGKEFMPAVDQGQFAVRVELSPGTALKVTDEVASDIENYLLNHISVGMVAVNIGSEKEKKAADILQTMGQHQAEILVNLKPVRPWWVAVDFFGAYRHDSSRSVIQGLKRYLAKSDLHGAQIEYILQENVLQAASSTSAPIVIDVRGYDLKYLEDTALLIREKLARMHGVYGVRDSVTMPSPEERVMIDKDKAAVMGLTVSDVAQVMQAAVEGKVASRFKKDGKEYNIRVRLRESDRKDMQGLSKLVIHSPAGNEISLTDVAQIKSGRGPTEIVHENKERTIKVWANLYKRSVDSAVREIQNKIINKMEIKKGYSAKIAGEVLQMKESFMGLLFAALLSLVMVYMVMAAQFENLTQPFLIMFTVPLALIGIAAALFITFTKISVMVFLGLIVMGGVVVNNGIVLIDCINRLRADGMPLEEALIEGARMRFRPIIMTAATSVLGLVPLGLGLSEGAKLQQPMAITIMSGLTVSTFLSLVIIPAFYLRAANKKKS